MEEVGEGVGVCLSRWSGKVAKSIYVFHFIFLYAREKCTEAIRRPAQ